MSSRFEGSRKIAHQIETVGTMWDDTNDIASGEPLFNNLLDLTVLESGRKRLAMTLSDHAQWLA